MGNRTHQGSFSPPSPVLKTGPPTSDDCASSISSVFMVTLSTGTSIGCCCWEGRTEMPGLRLSITVRKQQQSGWLLIQKKGLRLCAVTPRIFWSGREDSNFRPPTPEAGALPGCATPRRRFFCSGSKGFCQQENLPKPTEKDRFGSDCQLVETGQEYPQTARRNPRQHASKATEKQWDRTGHHKVCGGNFTTFMMSAIFTLSQNPNIPFRRPPIPSSGLPESRSGS